MTRLLIPLTALFLFPQCQVRQVHSGDTTHPSLSAFQHFLDSLTEAEATVPAIIVHLEAPDAGLSWSAASGVTNLTSGIPATPDLPARIASNTKTYVASTILKLIEQGKLALDDPISKHLSEEHLNIIRSEYEPDDITISHLLTHTAGLFDHAASATYMQKVMSDPLHRWDRTQQLKGLIDWGDPVGEVGELFRYSDSGYVLLGEIIERITGKSYAVAMREILNYSRLGLRSTWIEILETAPEGVPDRIHQYIAETDTYEFDPSLDLYGGGGIACTARDMAVFYVRLFNGEVFENNETLTTMTTGNPGVESPYKMGIFSHDFEGHPVYSHSGFWNTQVIYFPHLNAAVSLIITQQQGAGQVRRLAMAEAFSALEAIVEK